MTFDYDDMLEKFYENYYFQKWSGMNTLWETWRLLKSLGGVPALDELAKSKSLNL
jgi:hypothetical protein